MWWVPMQWHVIKSSLGRGEWDIKFTYHIFSYLIMHTCSLSSLIVDMLGVVLMVDHVSQGALYMEDLHSACWTRLFVSGRKFRKKQEHNCISMWKRGLFFCDVNAFLVNVVYYYLVTMLLLILPHFWKSTMHLINSWVEGKLTTDFLNSWNYQTTIIVCLRKMEVY